MGLNERQQNVARASGAAPLKVIAGAGTGKTETLAARFVELVRSGVPPSKIVLLTFTEDAAAEMRERVRLRLAEAGLDLAAHELLDLWCHTFHGFAMRLLRGWGWAVGLAPAPAHLDEVAQQTLKDTLVAAWEEHLDHGIYRPLDHARYRWESGEAWDKALTVFDGLRASGATPGDLGPHPRLRALQEARFAAEWAQLRPLIEDLDRAYTSHLRRSSVLDYDEQIAAARRLLEVWPALREQFEVVMVDEFQDTNPAQLQLLALLRPDWSAVTVVGDPRQAIYGWRSARPDVLRSFPPIDGQPIGAVPLRDNYRSRNAIVEVANLALLHSELAAEEQLVATRVNAPDLAAARKAPDVSLRLLPTVADEAGFIADQMATLLASGIRPREIALLLRARTHLGSFTSAMERRGIPYIVNGGTGFFAEPSVRLIASLVQLVLDPEERAAAVHVLESPLVGLDLRLLAWDGDVPGAATRWLLDPQSAPHDLPEREAVIERLEAFARFYAAARARSLLFSPSDFLVWLLASSGLRRWWHEQGDAQALRDLDKLIGLADKWRAAQPGLTVAAYVERLRRSVETQMKEAIPVAHSSDAVTVTTVHGAKGREWPVVFVAHTDLPSRKSSQVEHVLWDDEWKLVISDGKSNTKGGDPLADLRHDMRRRARNEERSIWYVALTRARDRLVVTHSGCEVDEQGHFADARAKLLSEDEPGDDTVHFFHELWQHVRAERARLGEAIFWGPGACSGAGHADLPPIVARPIEHVSQPSAHLRAAWNRALDEPG